MPLNIGIIGLGLIGGSIAKGLKQYNQDHKIFAYDTNQSSLERALEKKVIDVTCQDITKDFKECHVLFLCTPVNTTLQILPLLKKGISKDCLIKDVGSTKKEIETMIYSLDLQSQFIGGHPMAGSESFGYLSSQADLFHDAYYILIPTKEVSKEKIQLLEALISQFGAIQFSFDSTTHDLATAAISHLPHIAAAGLVHIVDEFHDNIPIKQLLAGGFKTTTRIASSSPDMWQQICINNKKEIQVLLNQYIKQLQDFSLILESNNEQAIFDFFAKAKEFRDSIL